MSIAMSERQLLVNVGCARSIDPPKASAEVVTEEQELKLLREMLGLGQSHQPTKNDVIITTSNDRGLAAAESLVAKGLAFRGPKVGYRSYFHATDEGIALAVPKWKGYVRRPDSVKAIRYAEDGSNLEEVVFFVRPYLRGAAAQTPTYRRDTSYNYKGRLHIATGWGNQEPELTVDPGSYVYVQRVQGIDRQVWVLAKDAFDKLFYDPEEAADQ